MANFTVRYLRQEEYRDWDQFVEAQQEGRIYHLSVWLRTIYKFQHSGIQIRVLVCRDKQDRIIGGIAFGSLKKFGVRLVVPPKLTQYWGVLLSHRKTKYPFKDLKYRKEILEALIEFLERDHQIIDLVLPPEITDIRAFSWHRYNQKVKYTFQSKLDDQERIYGSFDPDIRRQIKRAEDQHIRVDHGSDEEFIQRFYRLQALSLDRQEWEFHFNLPDFLSLVSELRKNGVNIRIYTANIFDRSVAASALLIYKDTAYYWLAGGESEYFKSGVNQLIIWSIIKDVMGLSIVYFDLVGANLQGVADYKATYGFDLVPYFAVKKVKGIYPNVLMQVKETFL